MKRRQFLQSSVAAAVAAALPTSSLLAAVSEVNAAVDALTGDGKQVTLEQAAVKELSDSLRGQLLLPGQEGYETARRVLNPAVDKHPALVVRPSGPADIMNAVAFTGERHGGAPRMAAGTRSWRGRTTAVRRNVQLV